jgi:limonene-1,2-epoxide hydrolase
MPTAFDEARAEVTESVAANIAIVEKFFGALEALDFEKTASFFSGEGVYEDVPAPAGDATGPEAIRKKLWVGLHGLDRFVLRFSRVVASGNAVASERVEDWHFPSGEVISLPVFCLHEICDGKITRWREYWNLPSLVDNLPPGWMEGIITRSTS